MANLFMLTRGCKLVIPAPTFNASVGLEAAEAEGATIWYGTPTMYVDLLGRHQRTRFDLTVTALLKYLVSSDEIRLNLSH